MREMSQFSPSPFTAMSEPSFTSHLKCRCVCEWRIIRNRLIPEWLLMVFFILYINQYVLRTLGFYRHRQIVDYIPASWCEAISHSPQKPAYWKAGDTCLDHAVNLTNHATLVDLMQDMIPDAEGNHVMKVFPEVVEGMTIVFVAFIFLYCSLIRRPGLLGKRPYIASMLTRCLRNLVFVFAARPLFYLVTSLPGPAAKCVGPHEESVRPKNWYQIFYDFSLGGDNCGDLIFSGHMSSLMVLICCFFEYGRRLLDPHVTFFNVVRVFLVVVVLLQTVLISAAKNHYTVDMVCAIFIGLMGWRLYYHEFGPDPEPIEFHADFKAAENSEQNPKAKEELLARCSDDAAFANYVDYDGFAIGAAVMGLIVIAFFLIIYSTFAALLS